MAQISIQKAAPVVRGLGLNISKDLPCPWPKEGLSICAEHRRPFLGLPGFEWGLSLCDECGAGFWWALALGRPCWVVPVALGCWILTSGTQVVPEWSGVMLPAGITTHGMVQTLVCFAYPISPHPVGIYSLPQRHIHCFNCEHFPWQQLHGFLSLKELKAWGALPHWDPAVTPRAMTNPFFNSPNWAASLQ